MKISVVGTGYVGLVTGTCLSDLGNDVICVDVDEKKIDDLQNGIIPIYEPGLAEMVKKNYQIGTLRFTTDIKLALDNSNICFIAVGTPMGEDGSADMKYVFEAAESIGKYMTHKMYVVDKSTVPVGSYLKVKEIIEKELNNRGVSFDFFVISNPEFLKEGNAVADAMRPDRIIIGTDDDEPKMVMDELYKGFVINSNNIIHMDLKSAEMTKYAANCMLATKISFINEMSNLCELVGADINKVRIGIGSDRRIGLNFIYPGCGYGGSCFPKDVKALIKSAEDVGYDCRILKAVQRVNSDQKKVLVKKVVKRFGDDLSGFTFGVWGLAFKPETDDMRESASIVIVTELVKRGATIKAYDPKASESAKAFYLAGLGNIEYVDSKYSALTGSNAMILVTEWSEFRNPDFDEMRKRMADPIIFDGRNQYDRSVMKKYGFEYYQIGVR